MAQLRGEVRQLRTEVSIEKKQREDLQLRLTTQKEELEGEFAVEREELEADYRSKTNVPFLKLRALLYDCNERMPFVDNRHPDECVFLTARSSFFLIAFASSVFTPRSG
ncbi:hypothetical protein AAG906_019680 [Vitis piasezkii]